MSWHRKLPNQAACGSCCGIKEKLQTLWDRTINSILRINQVEPDDQGNIRIRSDSEALTITEGTNEIVLDLDTSELPAASVISVNGETGAVQLTGDDIPSLYNGTVNSNLAGLWSTKAQRADLTAEITNRQNADTALQNNINALQASIPQEAADAVAADPTVQSFAAAAADIPNKVDKRTGAGLRAYTHTGSTQDDTPVIDGTTGTTIPIRDSNGRLQAADPAAGATDKTLVTANWVSQTGDSGPNNIVHKGGNETIPGIKTFTEIIIANKLISTPNASIDDNNNWHKMIEFDNPTNFNEHVICTIWYKYSASPGTYAITASNTAGAMAIVKISGTNDNTAGKFAISRVGTNHYILWGKSRRLSIQIDKACTVNGNINPNYLEFITSSDLATQYTTPTGDEVIYG